MQLKFINHNKILHIRLPLDNLNIFYVAAAKVINNQLITYASNNELWFDKYLDNWQHDGIVAKTPVNLNGLFNLIEWGLGAKNKNNIIFYNMRKNITNCDIGLTMYKSYQKNDLTISEFYAIGSPLNLIEQMEKREFVKNTLINIHHAINSVDLN